MREIRSLIAKIKSELSKHESDRDYGLINSSLDSIGLFSEFARHELTHDQLTGLSNDRALQELIIDYESRKKNIAIAILDIVGLKHVNDNFGMDYGDELILKAAKYLENAKRENDFLHRSGHGCKADEFYLLTDNTSYEKERQFLERLVQDAKNEFILVKGLDIDAKIPLRFAYGFSINDGSTSIFGTKSMSRYALTEGKRRAKSITPNMNVINQ
ncbi:GGDEF domain-containing protein [Candidatus Woesearchaeota archaeon]|nr:GGDEF domain-containing protein [Candidatus Woesearchaeota archaeon]